MCQRKWESHSLNTDETSARDFLIALAIARFLEDLLQSTHFLRFLQEQPHGLFQVLESLLLGAATGGNIQLQGMSHIAASLFENAGGELNLHCFVRLMLTPKK